MSYSAFVAQGGFHNTSDLYTADAATGVMTSIGPIGFAMTGLVQDPTDFTLYGITSGNSTAHPRSLISIDPSTGAGTFIGALTINGIADLTCDSTGRLFGMGQQGKLYSINKITGVATVVGASHFTTEGGGTAFDLSDVLWSAYEGIADFGGAYFPEWIIDPATGGQTTPRNFSGGPGAIPGYFAPAMACNPDDGSMWAIVQDGNPAWSICPLDTATGFVSAGVVLDHTEIDAFAWVSTLANDFRAALTPSTLTMTPASSGTATISTTTTRGAAQTITPTTGALPSGVTISFAPNPFSSGTSSVATVSTTGLAAPGTYSILITLTGSLGATHFVTLTLVVARSDFSMALAPSTLTIGAGHGASSTLSTVDTLGPASSITLSTLGLFAGWTVTFAANPIAAGAHMTVAVGVVAGEAAGTYAFLIVGDSADAHHTVALTVIVRSATAKGVFDGAPSYLI